MGGAGPDVQVGAAPEGDERPGLYGPAGQRGDFQ